MQNSYFFMGLRS